MTLLFYARRLVTDEEIIVEHEDLGEREAGGRQYVSRFTWDGQSVDVVCFIPENAHQPAELRMAADGRELRLRGIVIPNEDEFETVEDRKAREHDA